MLIQRGLVVSLDRGYPLVRTARGEERAQHAIELVKNSDVRAAVGDNVALYEEPGQDMLLITAIEPRSAILARREVIESIHEGAGKTKEQILAVNFDFVIVVQSLGKRALDVAYLERQLVMAYESNKETIVLLTKKDAARHLRDDRVAAQAAAPQSTVLCMSSLDHAEAFAELALRFSQDQVGVLLGRSGVGKSTLVNLLAQKQVQTVASVRAKDSAGRHTTVARRMVDLPDGGAVIDTPGMRAIGVAGDKRGLERTFPEIAALATECHYRDCTHIHEPSCAARAAVETGSIAARRLESYCELAAEVLD